MKRSAKVDSNQPEIVAALRKAGCYVLHLHQLKNAFDLLVFWRGHVWCVEVKDGGKPPSKRKLTEGEQECKKSMEAVGVKYHIVESVDQALILVGAIDTK